VLESKVVKRLHVVPGLDAIGNGMSVAAHLIADAAYDDLIEARQFASGNGDANSYDEIWVHSCWLPSLMKSCRRVVKAGKPLVCMPHGNLDPVRLRYHALKKRLLGPFERWALRKASRVVATCDAESEWIRTYEPRVRQIEIVDLKRFFKLPNSVVGVVPNNRPLHLLYLGRQHPLRGLDCLEAAVKAVEGVELRVVSNAFGEEKEKVWEWCDVLVLPTLSDNFGLVIAEALERGKCVITTDGAPAWGGRNDYDGRLVYLKGYRDGSPEERARLLRAAVEACKINPTGKEDVYELGR